jgi:hypothetical protein
MPPPLRILGSERGANFADDAERQARIRCEPRGPADLGRCDVTRKRVLDPALEPCGSQRFGPLPEPLWTPPRRDAGYEAGSTIGIVASGSPSTVHLPAIKGLVLIRTKALAGVIEMFSPGSPVAVNW